MNTETSPPISSGLEWAHPLVRDWFVSRFGTPTEPQREGWPYILSRQTTLICAPTGSGKTLAAFLICIDRLVRKALSGGLTDRTEVLYVSPLKALSNDIQKNLEIPLGEILQLAGQRGILMPEIRAAVRTGDTLAHERRAMLARPPHILVTTPESLYILLTAAKSREILRTVETVIVDEIHAVADDKRGAHLALSLERLDHLTGKRLPRIGLSATQKPIELVAHFLTGTDRPDPVIVQIGHRRELDIAVEVPGSELGPVATNEMWAEIYDRIAGLATQHRSTLVFVNTRRLAERMAHHLAERLGKEAVAAHHGSLSRKLRLLSNWVSISAALIWFARLARRGPFRWACSVLAARVTGVEQCPKVAFSRPPATTCWNALRWCAPFVRGISTASPFPKHLWTFWRSRSWPCAPPRIGVKTNCSKPCAALIRTAILHGRISMRSSRCSPKAWPARADAMRHTYIAIA